MKKENEGIHVHINVVEGQQGAEFDATELHIPGDAITVWINQTDFTQVILPLTPGIRRVMTLAPKGRDGMVWMLGSSQAGTSRWQLQSNPTAQITITKA